MSLDDGYYNFQRSPTRSHVDIQRQRQQPKHNVILFFKYLYILTYFQIKYFQFSP